MQIETFEQTEVVAGVPEEEREQEAIELIDRLGLKGQQELTAPKQESDVRVRNPYRKMSTMEYQVYKVLYPETTKIESYSSGMIPLRVLQVAAHARELGFYKSIEIWSERTRPVDPLLVGVFGDYSEKPHILARWGDALESFDVLYEKAKKILIAQYEAKVKQTIAECQKILAAPDAYAHDQLNGQWVNIP